MLDQRRYIYVGPERIDTMLDQIGYLLCLTREGTYYVGPERIEHYVGPDMIAPIFN